MRQPFEQSHPIPGAVSGAIPEERMAFIRKVYAAFMGSILMLAVGVAGVLTVPGVGQAVADSFWVVIVAEFAALAGVIFLRKRAGLRLLLFGAFSLITGLTTGLLVAQYVAQGMGDVVLQAAGLTVVAFGGLTTYAFTSGKDFSFLRGFVTTGLFVVVGGSILTWFIDAPALSFAVAGGGVLLFSGFILYDTSNIIRRYREDEWLSAAMGLYLDVLNLFLFLLRLLARRD